MTFWFSMSTYIVSFADVVGYPYVSPPPDYSKMFMWIILGIIVVIISLILIVYMIKKNNKKIDDKGAEDTVTDNKVE